MNAQQQKHLELQIEQSKLQLELLRARQNYTEFQLELIEKYGKQHPKDIDFKQECFKSLMKGVFNLK